MPVASVSGKLNGEAEPCLCLGGPECRDRALPLSRGPAGKLNVEAELCLCLGVLKAAIIFAFTLRPDCVKALFGRGHPIYCSECLILSPLLPGAGTSLSRRGRPLEGPAITALEAQERTFLR